MPSDESASDDNDFLKNTGSDCTIIVIFFKKKCMMDEREGSGSSGCAFDLFKLVKNVVDNTKKRADTCLL